MRFLSFRIYNKILIWSSLIIILKKKKNRINSNSNPACFHVNFNWNPSIILYSITKFLKSWHGCTEVAVVTLSSWHLKKLKSKLKTALIYIGNMVLSVFMPLWFFQTPSLAHLWKKPWKFGILLNWQLRFQS